MFKRIFIFLLTITFASISIFNTSNQTDAQDIPELHMLVLQGDIFISGSQTSSVDSLELTAKINDKVVGSVEISKGTTSSRYVSLEIGPKPELEGQLIEFWIGNQKANETRPFGPTTPSGTYCNGCSWVLPLSINLDLSFNSFPQATPTPIPESALPAFLTGNVIFGSVLAAPDSISSISAFIGDELIGTGSISGSSFSITIDPGTVDYIGKIVTFEAAGTKSKTTYIYEEDAFITDFKLFFPEFIPPTSTPTPMPIATAIPTATSTPEPTRTPTPVPEPTPTYTPTPTPTPISVLSSSSSENNLIAADSSEGGCNSRGGGPASVGLIIMSLAPVYLLNRKRKLSK
tara:strand:+ start:219 stop:1256 length:1038 start_codon:yes stop_codon:yes gene_type:complete